MSNHLHEVLDQVAARKVQFAGRVLPIQFDQVKARFGRKGIANSAICFDIGDMDGLWCRPVQSEHFALPYPVCWFEGTFWSHVVNSEIRIGMLAIEGATPSQFAVVTLGRKSDTPWRYTGSMDFIVSDGKYGDQDESENMPAALVAFLSALRCSNVERIKHEPDSKLVRSRLMRGKPPPFSFWTLAVDLDRDVHEAIPLGGTHSSPRLHLRRGHWRRLASGREVWVRWCEVGSSELGVVHKDYAARTAIEAQHAGG